MSAHEEPDGELPGLRELVETVRALPYGRPSERTVQGMLRERRGTCSTKHLFIAQAVAKRYPDTQPQIIHRVYTVTPQGALPLFGEEAAARVPAEGLIDVHRYLTVQVAGRRIPIDATFPGPPWDGRSPLPLACGPGRDFPAGEHPDADKRALEARFCDPAKREPFIAAMSASPFSS